MTSPSAAQTTNSPSDHGPGSGANAWATGLTLFAGVILATVGKHSARERSVLIMAGGIAACDWWC